MRKLFFSSILLFVACTGFTQNTDADSLRTLLSNTKEDTGKALLFTDLSRLYLTSKPDTSLFYAREGLALSREIGFKNGEVLNLRQLGHAFTTVGNYPAALAAYLDAKKIIDETGDEHNVGRILSNLSDVYFYQGDYKRSIDYSHQAVKIFSKQGNQNAIVNAYIGLGDTYEKNNQLDSAKFYTQLASRPTSPENPLAFGIILNNLGNIFRKSGQPDSAMIYYYRAIPHLQATVNEEGLCETLMGMAEIFLNKKQVDSSLSYAKRAYQLAKAGGFTQKLMVASNFLASFYKSANNIDSAFAYQQATIAAKDSLFSQQKANQIQSMTYDEFMRQQQLESARQREQARLRQNALTGGLVTLFIVVLLLVINNRQRKKANLQIAKQKETVEETLQELRITQAQLIQSEKMASLGELTAGIAHEIQNPLNFVNNFSMLNTELLDEMQQAINSNDQAELKSIAAGIRNNEEKITFHGKRAADIVKGMLQHARASSGKKEPTDINKLADEYLQLSYQGMRSKDKSFNTMLETDFDNSVHELNVERQEIGRVLLNLYNNAFYAVQQKRRQQGEGYQPTVSVKTQKKDNHVLINVKDNGGGIPQHIMEKVFQPFFTTKPTGEGTGLGLSLSYDIVTKGHGGVLSVHSLEGKGTEFVVKLPVA